MAKRKADQDDEDAKKGSKQRFSFVPIRLILIFLLLVWLMSVLADSYGIEGEGGWQGEIMSAFLFILGIIVAAGAMVGALIIVRNASGGGKNASRPWGDSGEIADPGDEGREADSSPERPEDNNHTK